VNIAARAGDPQPGLVDPDDRRGTDGGLDALLRPEEFA
jgi:hypothetical protein